MRDAGHGTIVNVASIGGLTGSAGAAYTASKHSVISRTRSIAYLPVPRLDGLTLCTRHAHVPS